MKTLVICKSKTGFTQKYCHMLQEKLGADSIPYKQVSLEIINDYDTIIYGGGLYAAGINGLKKIKKLFNQCKHKNLIIFTTGVCTGREDELNEVQQMNFSDEEVKNFKFFYFRGGFDFNKLNPLDKILMRILKWKLNRKNKKDLTPDEKGMLAIYNHPVDFINEENIKPLLDYIEAIN